jgi:mannose-6-phosphate isomerase
MILPFASLDQAADWFSRWLREFALPLWSTHGRDQARASFHEALGQDLVPLAGQRRSRVQTRQVWVYANAAVLDGADAYARIARQADAFHDACYRRPDGLFAYAADAGGEITADFALLYDQAFAVLAWAALERATGQACAARALALRAAIQPLAHPAGGYRESGAQPFQANAHMHLLEASLAWEELGDASWQGLSDSLIALATDRFIDPDSGVLKEFFDERWTALADSEGGLVEPGHQFEWAWLLDRWSQVRGDDRLRPVAEKLYANGLRGIDRARNVAVGSLASDLLIRDAATRVWPQTEWLKAALIFGAPGDALRAAGALAGFLHTDHPGLWRERMAADGTLSTEPAPATSLYHITGAVLPLLAATGRIATAR